ncbi:hypothetical protein EIP86_005614 [Pleurotus ostreatoroseus]|nr:hypothetical protein EIP86_005614 [Pleurotus ostreatoroseus]
MGILYSVHVLRVIDGFSQTGGARPGTRPRTRRVDEDAVVTFTPRSYVPAPNATLHLFRLFRLTETRKIYRAIFSEPKVVIPKGYVPPASEPAPAPPNSNTTQEAPPNKTAPADLLQEIWKSRNIIARHDGVEGDLRKRVKKLQAKTDRIRVE